MTGNEYRELLKKLNLSKALEAQTHSGFKSEYVHSVYERDLICESASMVVKPPPIKDDVSHLIDHSRVEAAKAITRHWKRMTPEQREIQIAKRRRSGSKWKQKAQQRGTIEMRDFATNRVVSAKNKTKPTNANQDRKSFSTNTKT